MKLAYKSPDIPIKSKDFSKTITIDTPSTQELQFNILNDRSVNEKLTFKKFIIKNNRIESYFDREESNFYLSDKLALKFTILMETAVSIKEQLLKDNVSLSLH